MGSFLVSAEDVLPMAFLFFEPVAACIKITHNDVS